MGDREAHRNFLNIFPNLNPYSPRVESKGMSVSCILYDTYVVVRSKWVFLRSPRGSYVVVRRYKIYY